MTEENSLVDRLGSGEAAAFKELVERYKKKVYFLAWDMVRNQSDAEDISQEVFLKVFRSLKTFRKGSTLGSWLYRITYNVCIDHLRKKAITPESMKEAELEEVVRKNSILPRAQNLDPRHSAEKALLQRRIEQALQKVSTQEKAVFLLRHYNNLVIKDIAETLNLSIGSVKSYLSRAVKKIQKELAVSKVNSGSGGLS